MDKEEHEVFLSRTLNLLENAVNFLTIQNKHILAYRKMLGIQQKFEGLEVDKKKEMVLDVFKVKTINHYLLDGRYRDALTVMNQLKTSLYHQLYRLRPREP